MVNKEYENMQFPSWVVDPEPLIRLIDQGLYDFAPWQLLDTVGVAKRAEGLKIRYPARQIYPFARRFDQDDVACWDESMQGRVVVIHDFASAGHETKHVYNSFWDWFRTAIEDMILFEP